MDKSARPRRNSGKSKRRPPTRSASFYGFNRPGATISQGVIQNWWQQGMIGSAKAHFEGIKAFSETDQTEDL